MNFLNKYQQYVERGMTENIFSQNPMELYEPNNYILNLGGKRLRPIMVLMGADLFDGDLEIAIKPALAVEFFHNFTLMHDDIMDSAPLRRGKETVHIKYNTNTAILSGDALLIKSYQLFEDLPADLFKPIVQLFSKTAAEICDGQQYDMNFETQKVVTYEEYVEMITLKTGVMVAAAFKIGALIAGASETDAQNLYAFGKSLGLAFQLKDDYLDVFGNEEVFGKKHAGDIFENKKTVLYFLSYEAATDEERKELDFWFNMNTANVDKVYAVEKIFRRTKVDQKIIKLMKAYSDEALNHLEAVAVEEEKKKSLKQLVSFLMEREV